FSHEFLWNSLLTRAFDPYWWSKSYNLLYLNLCGGSKKLRGVRNFIRTLKNSSSSWLSIQWVKILLVLE
ncbi:unnamed protein product, partial [Linum tenue]